MNSLATRVFIIAVVLAITALIAAPDAAADYCTWIPDCDEYGQCSYHEECSPEYLTEMTVQPDWCLYNAGDQVWVRLNSSGQQFRWYVYHANDNNAERPSSLYDPSKRFVQKVGGNCFLVYFW